MEYEATKQCLRIAVIGAGPCGITAAKNVIEAGLGDGLVVFEKSDALGGNWVYREQVQHSSVYESAHTISSRYLSEYEDFPFQTDAPDYLSHKYLRRYFELYAENFQVTSKIQFQTEVCYAKPLVQEDQHGEAWEVEIRDLQNGETHVEIFDVLMVANGHHWDPRMPAFQGSFSGHILHSHAFKHNRPFRNQRVLVVGGGNSACDVAVECSRVAQHTCLSMRHGHWFVPKFIFGIPTDVFHEKTLWLPVPRFLRNLLYKFVIYLIQGSHRRLGLPTPSYGVLEGHVTLNSELAYALGHGAIVAKPGIRRLDGSTVHFTNGTCQQFDTIVCATGYNISFPFFDKSFIDWKDVTQVPLWRRMFHPTMQNLYFIGLFQPLGCIWPLADYQAMLACQEILGQYKRPSNLNAAIDYERKHPHHPFVEAPRHSTEVDYHVYRQELLRELWKCRKTPRRTHAASPLLDRWKLLPANMGLLKVTST
jgi:Flavin-binding monooxygenase-like